MDDTIHVRYLVIPLSSCPQRLFVARRVSSPMVTVRHFRFGRYVTFFLGATSGDYILSFQVVLRSNGDLLHLFVQWSRRRRSFINSVGQVGSWGL